MSASAEALVLASRDRLPTPSSVRNGLVAAGLDLEWEPFAGAADELNAYVVAPGRPDADAFLSISTQPLGDAERTDLLQRAAAQLGQDGAAPIAQADALVRISARQGPEFDAAQAFDAVLSMVGAVTGAVAYLVGEDEYVDAATLAARLGHGPEPGA